MLKSRRRLSVAAFGLLLLAMPASLLAQNSTTVGPPQLKDFQLPGERRTPPRPPQQIEPTPTPTPPTQRGREAEPERARRADPRPEPTRPGQATPARSTTAVPSQPEDVFQFPAAPQTAAPAARAPMPTATPQPTPGTGSSSIWFYLLPIGLAGLAFVAWRRRRRPASETVAVAEPVAPAAPRAAPIPRPWLEIELTAERAASTDDEASVEFEMILHNTGKSSARNIRINARMFNAGREQDKEIGAFFKTRGEGRRTHVIPELPPGERGLIQGTVTMPREEMRALKVNEQLLFIPVVAVNVVYDWGNGRSGQTSKSYVIGRELGKESEKMGAFRLDLGPRIYRTVGQRQHSLAKRV